MVIFYTGTNDLKSNQNQNGYSQWNHQFNKEYKDQRNGRSVSISSLTPRGDPLSEKGKKIRKSQEKCTEKCIENFAFILRT